MSLIKIVCGSESLSLCISANLLKLFSLVHARQTFGCELLNLAKVRSLSQPKLAAKIQIWLGTWFLWFLRFQSPGLQLDGIGKESLNPSLEPYKYKDIVEIPILRKSSY